MSLDTPLGKLNATPHNTWFPCYQAKDTIFLRDDAYPMIQKFVERMGGFYKFDSKVETAPLESYPCMCYQVREDVWTQHPMNINRPVDKTEHPPGYIVCNNLKKGARTMKKGKAASDGSVHIRQHAGATARLIAKDETSFVTACFLMTGINIVSSYRLELEGIFWTLKHMEYLKMTPEEVM